MDNHCDGTICWKCGNPASYLVEVPLVGDFEVCAEHLNEDDVYTKL